MADCWLGAVRFPERGTTHLVRADYHGYGHRPVIWRRDVVALVFWRNRLVDPIQMERSRGAQRKGRQLLGARSLLGSPVTRLGGGRRDEQRKTRLKPGDRRRQPGHWFGGVRVGGRDLDGSVAVGDDQIRASGPAGAEVLWARPPAHHPADGDPPPAGRVDRE